MSNKVNIHIAISGRSGCGNTTVSRTLAERVGLKFINYTFKTIAQEDGMSFAAVCKRAELSDDDDLRVDSTQVKLASQEPSVIGSRLAIWLIEGAALKVFLTASLQKRVERIFKREGGKLEDVIIATQSRDKRDHSRYLRIYGINNYDYQLADLVINTERLEASQVVDIIEVAARSIIQSKE